MKILNKGTNTINLDEEINNIVKHLFGACNIYGDKELIYRRFDEAIILIDKLRKRIQDGSADVVYVRILADDMLKEHKRIKKEAVEILCETDDEARIMSAIMDIASQVIVEDEILIPTGNGTSDISTAARETIVKMYKKVSPYMQEAELR